MESSSESPQPDVAESTTLSSPTIDSASSNSPSSVNLDNLLDKYITVWIWSVLFGASSGLVISLITYRTDARWGPLNAILLLFLIISIVAAVISWRALMRYMSVYLIPKFLLHQFSTRTEKKSDDKAQQDESKPLSTDELEAERKAADSLRRAFEYLVIAAGARVVITLLEMAYSSLIRF
jgi:hypothetical protein